MGDLVFELLDALLLEVDPVFQSLDAPLLEVDDVQQLPHPGVHSDSGISGNTISIARFYHPPADLPGVMEKLPAIDLSL